MILAVNTESFLDITYDEVQYTNQLQDLLENMSIGEVWDFRYHACTVKRSQKEDMVSLILKKREQNKRFEKRLLSYILSTKTALFIQPHARAWFVLFFGRIEDTTISFKNFLTFSHLMNFVRYD